MKTSKLEIVLIFLTLCAIASKVLELPATGILTIVFFSSYAIFSLIYVLIKLNSLEGILNKVISVIIGLFAGLSILSIAWIFMSWSNARLFLISSSSVLIISSLVLILLNRLNDKKLFDYLSIKGLMVGCLVMFIFCLPKYTIFKLKHLSDPKLVQLHIEKEEKQTTEARQAFSIYVTEIKRQRSEGRNK